MNNKLSICIPTYNRSDKLHNCLELIINKIINYDIPVYISDNASSDDTYEVVCELQKKYEYLFYSCNETNVGPDYNFTQVLKMSKSNYSWLMSDDDLIMDNGIDIILKAINDSSYDLIVVNAIQGYLDDKAAPIRVKSSLDTVYVDMNELLIDLGWHMTWMSCLVFSEDIIKNGNFIKYQGTNFIHFGVIFDRLSQKKSKVLWINNPIICTCKDNIASYPEEKTFDLFVKDWSNIVMSLPSVYSEMAKKKCIKNHAINLAAFNFRWFLSARVRGVLNLNSLNKYRNYFKFATDTSLLYMLTLCFIPRTICSLMETTYSKIYQIINTSKSVSTRSGFDEHKLKDDNRL